MFDAIVMVDWSAAASPGGSGGQRNGLWMAVGLDDEPTTVRPARTRGELRRVLGDLLARWSAAGRRVLVGVDACFGYPAGTAAALKLDLDEDTPWRATWAELADLIRDDPDDNGNNRFEVAAMLNERLAATSGGPFWGRAHGSSASDSLQATRPVFPVPLRSTRRPHRLEELRTTEHHLRQQGHQPKSVWQIAYAGSVGGQTLTAIPHLLALRDDPRLADHTLIWPLETGFDLPIGTSPLVVLAEVYPSTVTPPKGRHRVHDAAQVLTLVDQARTRRDDGSLWRAFARPAGLTVAAAEPAIAEEGWVLPLAPPRPPSIRTEEPAAADVEATAGGPVLGSSPQPGGVGPGWDADWPIPEREIRHALHGYLHTATAPSVAQTVTGCPPWDGRDLTAHLVATVRRFTTCLLRTRSGDPSPPFTADGLTAANHAAVEAFEGQPERQLTAAVEGFLGLLDDPVEPIAHQRGLVPVGLQARWLLGELLLHHADLRGTDRVPPPPHRDVAALLVPAYAPFGFDPPGDDVWAALLRWTNRPAA